MIFATIISKKCFHPIHLHISLQIHNIIFYILYNNTFKISSDILYFPYLAIHLNHNSLCYLLKLKIFLNLKIILSIKMFGKIFFVLFWCVLECLEKEFELCRIICLIKFDALLWCVLRSYTILFSKWDYYVKYQKKKGGCSDWDQSNIIDLT